MKKDFLILSFPFHIQSILKLAPVLSQKSEKMHLVRTFCSSTAKTSTVTPIFYFMILIRTVLPFDEKKLAQTYVQFFGNFTKLYGLICHGSNSVCPTQFYFGAKVKTGALKGIFLVFKWINNTIKSNSGQYHMHHRKNLSFLSSFGLRAVFVKGSKIAVFVSIVTSKRAR